VNLYSALRENTSNEYHHKSYNVKTAILVTVMLQKCGSSFSQLDAVSCESYVRFGRINTTLRSLRRSESFNITDFGINQELLCNFLLFNNINLHLFFAQLPYNRTVFVKIFFVFDTGRPTFL